VFTKALKNDVIAWANGAGGRKNYDNLVNGQVVKISAKSPGSLQLDPETAMVIELRKKPESEREGYLRDLLAKASK